MNTTAELQARMLEAAIEVLRGLPTFGENPNWWRDITYDEQEGSGYLLDELYRDAVLGILATLIRKLAEPDVESLWRTTDRGWEYAFEKEWQEKGGESDENELARLYGTKEDRIGDLACLLLGELREKAFRANLDSECPREQHDSTEENED